MDQNLQPIIKELTKLYPKVKIPIEEYSDFYIQTLLKHKAYDFLPVTISNFNDLYSLLCQVDEGESITKYKFRKFDDILNFFKEKNLIKPINDFNMETLPVFKKQEFSNWKEDKIYISIDLIEANWSVFKKYSKIPEEYSKINWNSFTSKYFHLHPAINQSKSFRQYIFGNTNPKRLSRFQGVEIQNIIDILYNQLENLSIVSKNSDEIIIEHSLRNDNSDSIVIELTNDKELDGILYCIKNLNLELPIKYTIFTVENHTNYNESVKVKNILNDSLNTKYSELFGVPGNRFYIHFRTLILKEELQEEDLYFLNDKFKAKWLI